MKAPKRMHSPKSTADIATNELPWTRLAWAVILAVTSWRLAWLFLSPLDLVPDEAYYWDWGRRPDWCYFSKPPMIAWINTLTQVLGFTTTGLMRTPAVLLGAIGLVSIWLLARRLWGGRGGFFAVALSATAPGAIALNGLLTIDAPLLAAWSVALLALWRALEPTPKPEAGKQPPPLRASWWSLYVTAGICGILSKQMMLVLPALAFLFVITSPADRNWLRRPSFYAWLLAPLLGLLPILIWNLQHGWVTAAHTASHFDAPVWSPARAARFFAEYLGGQFGLMGPATFVAFVAAARSIPLARSDRRTWFLWIMSVPALLAIAALSLRQSINPNWPAAFHLAALVLAAGWLTHNWPRRARFWKVAWVSGILLTTIGYVAILAGATLGLHGHPKLDLTQRLRGWAEFGTTVGTVKSRLESEHGDKLAVIIHGGRSLTSELAFYLPGQPRTWRWTPPGTVTSQYDLWSGPLPDFHGRNALIVSTSADLPPGLAEGFDRITLIEILHPRPQTAQPRQIWLFLGENLHTWNHGRPLQLKL